MHRPFNFGTAVPTHEEVTRLATNIQQDCLQAIRDDGSERYDNVEGALSRLLAEVDSDTVFNAQETPSEKWQYEDTSVQAATFEQVVTALILTAAERRRLYRLPEPFFGVVESDQEQCPAAEQESMEPPAKRLKSANSLPEDLPPRASAQYLDNADDSGIFLPEWTTDNNANNDTPTSYLRLADSAHGFEGLDDDLNELFADVDPIHFDGFAMSGSGAAYDFGDCIDPVLLQTEQSRSCLGLQELKGDALFQHPQEDELHSCNGASIHSQQPEEYSQAVIPAANYMLPEIGRTRSFSKCHDVNSAKHSLEELMRLRSKSVATSIDPAPAPESSVPAVNVTQPSSGPPSFQVPKELVDHTTLQAPEHPVQYENWHRYLGSLEVIQKLAITRALSAPDCKVQLVERESLNGADIIIDPHTAIIIFPLRNLPTQCDSLNARINHLSWRFSWILVVFETTSFSDSNASKNSLAVNPFSPAVVKAVKKVRRDMEIAEACLDKQEGVRVQFAFPMSVPAAAGIIRRYGDTREAEDISNRLLWDDRHWLDSDYEDPVRRLYLFQRRATHISYCVANYGRMSMISLCSTE